MIFRHKRNKAKQLQENEARARRLAELEEEIKIMEQTSCVHCVHGKSRKISGDNVSGSTYIDVVQCEFDDEYYKYPSDSCEKFKNRQGSNNGKQSK